MEAKGIDKIVTEIDLRYHKRRTTAFFRGRKNLSNIETVLCSFSVNLSSLISLILLMFDCGQLKLEAHIFGISVVQCERGRSSNQLSSFRMNQYCIDTLRRSVCVSINGSKNMLISFYG